MGNLIEHQFANLERQNLLSVITQRKKFNNPFTYEQSFSHLSIFVWFKTTGNLKVGAFATVI